MLKFDSLRELLLFNIKYYRYLNNFPYEKLVELSELNTRYITDAGKTPLPNYCKI